MSVNGWKSLAEPVTNKLMEPVQEEVRSAKECYEFMVKRFRVNVTQEQMQQLSYATALYRKPTAHQRMLIMKDIARFLGHANILCELR